MPITSAAEIACNYSESANYSLESGNYSVAVCSKLVCTYALTGNA